MKKISIVLIRIIFLIIVGFCIFGIMYNIKAADTKDGPVTSGEHHTFIVNESGKTWTNGEKVKKGKTGVFRLFVLKDEVDARNGKTYYNSVVCESSDTSIIEISNSGYASFNEVGFATITISSTDGLYQAKVTLEVTEAINGEIVPKNKEMAEINLKLQLNTHDEIELEMEYKDMGVKKRISENIMWESSKSDIVSIDSNGKVVALKEGQSTITAIYKDGEKTVIGEEILIEVSDDKTSHLQKEPESEFEKGFKGLKNIIINIISKIIYNIRKLFNINL